MSQPKEVFCIDPGLQTVDTQACSEIASLDPSLGFSHHLPATHGMGSILKREKEVSIKALLVLGSVASVHANAPWQADLNPWLFGKIKSGLPTLGICYGHQLIAKLFGGEVGYLNKDKRKFFGFRTFKLLPNCPLSLPFKEVEVVASHEEVVTKLPSEFEVFGESDQVPIEAFYHKSLPIVSFQTHPEAREDFCKERSISLEGRKDPFSGGRAIISSFMDYLKEESS